MIDKEQIKQEILEKMMVRQHRKLPLKIPTIFSINHVHTIIDLAIEKTEQWIREETTKKLTKFDFKDAENFEKELQSNERQKTAREIFDKIEKDWFDMTIKIPNHVVFRIMTTKDWEQLKSEFLSAEKESTDKLGKGMQEPTSQSHTSETDKEVKTFKSLK